MSYILLWVHILCIQIIVAKTTTQIVFSGVETIVAVAAVAAVAALSTTLSRPKINAHNQCHGESGTPELLSPHTKSPSECCTPIHDSLVDPVRGTLFV